MLFVKKFSNLLSLSRRKFLRNPQVLLGGFFLTNVFVIVCNSFVRNYFIKSFLSILPEPSNLLSVVFWFPFFVAVPVVWYIFRLLFFMFLQKDLNGEISIQLSRTPFFFRGLGLFIFVLLAYSALEVFYVYTFIFFALFFVQVILGKKPLKDYFFGLGSSLVHPQALSFFFFLLQINFICLVFFGFFLTFKILCFPLILFGLMPEGWAAVSEENTGSYFGPVKKVPEKFVTATSNVLTDNLLASTTSKIIDLHTGVTHTKILTTFKVIDIMCHNKSKFDYKFGLLEHTGFLTKKLFKEYMSAPAALQKNLAKYYPREILESLTEEELAFFYAHPLDVFFEIQAKFPKVQAREIVRGLLDAMIAKDPERALVGFVGENHSQGALEAMARNKCELGLNYFATFLKCDTNRLVQNNKPSAEIVNNFSADTVEISTNELSTALAYGESLNQGELLKVGRSVLGDAWLETKESSTVLSIKKNGQGTLYEALMQVQATLEKPDLCKLYTAESSEKGITDYVLVTEGTPFTDEELKANDSLITELNKRFNLAWNQKFSVVSLKQK